MRRVRVNGKLYPVELIPYFRWWIAKTEIDGELIIEGASSREEALRKLRKSIAEFLTEKSTERG